MCILHMAVVYSNDPHKHSHNHLADDTKYTLCVTHPNQLQSWLDNFLTFKTYTNSSSQKRGLLQRVPKEQTDLYFNGKERDELDKCDVKFLDCAVLALSITAHNQGLGIYSVKIELKYSGDVYSAKPGMYWVTGTINADTGTWLGVSFEKQKQPFITLTLDGKQLQQLLNNADLPKLGNMLPLIQESKFNILFVTSTKAEHNRKGYNLTRRHKKGTLTKRRIHGDRYNSITDTKLTTKGIKMAYELGKIIHKLGILLQDYYLISDLIRSAMMAYFINKGYNDSNRFITPTFLSKPEVLVQRSQVVSRASPQYESFHTNGTYIVVPCNHEINSQYKWSLTRTRNANKTRCGKWRKTRKLLGNFFRSKRDDIDYNKMCSTKFSYDDRRRVDVDLKLDWTHYTDFYNPGKSSFRYSFRNYSNFTGDKCASTHPLIEMSKIMIKHDPVKTIESYDPDWEEYTFGPDEPRPLGTVVADYGTPRKSVVPRKQSNSGSPIDTTDLDKDFPGEPKMTPKEQAALEAEILADIGR